MTKAQQKEQQRQEAIDYLREYFPARPDDEKPYQDMTWEERHTLPRAYTVLRHVSSSGMSRRISVIVAYNDDNGAACVRDISYLVARALDMRRNKDDGGIIIGGCGMDMGFALVYDLSQTLYGNGYTIRHDWL